jgi:hypothetical protein
MEDDRSYPYMPGGAERSLPVDRYTGDRDFHGTILYYFGSGPALWVVKWMTKADELDTVMDLVRALRKQYPDDVIANFVLGYFGGGGELDFKTKKLF